MRAMYDNILVPTDGRPATDRALGRALALARTFDARVHALFVADVASNPTAISDSDRDALRSDLVTRGDSVVEAATQRGEEFGVTVVGEVCEGVPEQTIRAYAVDHEIDLVVMGTRARETDEATLGSTTRRVLGRPEVPVAVVPNGEGFLEPGHGMFDTVVIPTDGSDAAGRAADHGLSIAERYGAEIRAVYVVDTTSHELADTSRSVVGLLREGGHNAVETIAAAARDRNLPVSTAVLDGVPGEEIAGYAESAGSDLLVMGARGAGPGEYRLGSTAERIVRRSDVPVLTTV